MHRGVVCVEYAKKALSENWPEWSIEEKLGEGSFGKVYKVKREYFGREQFAALKVIRISSKENAANFYSIDDKSIVDEIVSEIELMAKFKGNTNIVSYEDHKVIEDADGEGWTILIRMELLTPLSKKAADGLSADECKKLGVDICKALEILQKSNIVHRDIKADNIFISENGDYKLGDFGTARIFERTEDNRTKTGTFNYMAPEVIKSQPYGARADIYSLGILLYNFSNRNRFPFFPPFPEPVKFEDTQNALTHRITGTPMPEPCEADGKFASVILKACEYDAKKRYATATEMRLAIEALDEKDIPKTKTRKKIKINKKVLIIVLAAVAAVAVALGVAFGLSGKSGETRLIKENCSDGSYEYDVYNIGVEITAGLTDGETLEIPAEIDGRPVFSIGEQAFANKKFKKIVIPENVTSIGSVAFINCANLTDLVLPETLERIYGKAFADCASLTAVELPESLSTVQKGAFSGCDKLCDVVMRCPYYAVYDGAFERTAYERNRKQMYTEYLELLGKARSKDAKYALYDMTGDGKPELIVTDEGEILKNILNDDKTYYMICSFDDVFTSYRDDIGAYISFPHEEYITMNFDSLCENENGAGIYGYILDDGYEKIYLIELDENGSLTETLTADPAYVGDNAKLPGKEIVFTDSVAETGTLENIILCGVSKEAEE